jgi:protein-disulfide isomerase
MINRCKTIISFIAALSTPAFADDAEFDEAVRDALLRNPEIILEVFEVLERQQAAAATVADQELIARFAPALFQDAEQPERVLVEFIDYQCSYCRRAAPEVIALTETSPNVVRHVVQLPILGEASTNAAAVMEAIRLSQPHDVFLAAHDALMLSDPRSLRLLANFVAGQGLDPDQIMAIAESEEVQQIIAANHALARGMGISGTPGFVTTNAVIRGFADRQALAGMFANASMADGE